MRYTEVHDAVDRSCNVSEKSRNLEVSTPLTSAAGHRLCLYLGGCAREVREFHQCKHWARTLHSARDPERWSQAAFPYMGEGGHGTAE
jgi:hypothetical protein